MAEDKKMERMIKVVMFTAVLVIMAAAAPIEIDQDVIEEESDTSLAEEIIDYDDSKPSDTEMVANEEKRYFEDLFVTQSNEEKRQRIIQLKQKNRRDQRRRRMERKNKLRKKGRKKLRVNKDTPR